MEMTKIGEYLFLLGAIVAVLTGLGSSYVVGATGAWIVALLVLIGIVVGFLNVTEKEFTAFLVAAIALGIAGTAAFTAIDAVLSPIGTMITAIVKNLAILVAPAAVIVAVKQVMAMASKK
ncbi:MAG: hypothetical protein V1900_04705 [Candidatus Aenigmatarchaeota archaeon]